MLYTWGGGEASFGNAAEGGGDANGDGLDDIGYIKSGGTYAHRIHSGVKPDLMKTATDGYGNAITFNYSSIVESSYTKGTGGSYPDPDYAGPLSVVTSSVPTTGILDDTYTLTYTYSGLLFNLQGRGLSPFETKTTVDSRTGVKLLETFRRDFPYRGRLSSTELKQSDDTPIQEISNTWAKVSGGSANE